MSSKQELFNKTSSFIVSNQYDQFSKSDDSYIGKLRSNFFGSEYMLYDNGSHPKK